MLKRFLIFSALLLLVSCAGRVPSPEITAAADNPQRPDYHPTALQNFIRGNTFNQVGNFEAALNRYYEALLYDASPAFYNALGEVYLKMRRFDNAYQVLMRSLELDPELLETYEFLAVLFESNKDYLNMKLALEKVIELSPNDYDARFNLAVILLNEDEALKAAEIYEKLADDIGVNAEIAMRLGLIYSENAQYDRALKWLFDYTRLKPEDEDVYFEIAKIYAIRQDTLKIEPLFVEALKKNPELDRVRTELGQIYLHQNRLNDAVLLYQAAVSGNSVSVLNQLKLANLLLQDGDSTQSWNIFHQLVAEYPEDWRVQYAVGGVCRSLGKSAAAREHLEKALLLKPDLPSIREELAAVYRGEKAFDKALNLFVPMAKADSTDMAARFYIGDILVEKGDTTSALIFYEQEWEEHPNERRFPYSIGRLYYARHDHLTAQKYLTASFALNDTFSNTYLLLGISYMQTQQYDKAEQILKEGIKRFPDRFLLAEDLAVLYTKQNRLAEAEKLLNDIEGLIPDDETIHKSDWLLNYGKLYWEKGEKKKAVELWVNAIETDPSNHFAIFSLALYLDTYKNATDILKIGEANSTPISEKEALRIFM